MAKIGLKYLVCAPITETGTTVSYNNGLVMSRAIKADVSIELNEAKLFADDKMVENIREFKAGKIALNGDDLGYEVNALILGHTVTTMENGSKLVAKGDDDGAYVGVGFYSTTIKNGVKKYRALWIKKVKFGVPSESSETKGDSVNFQTANIEGVFLTDATGVWKEEITVDTEQAAIDWLNEQADMFQA